MFTTGLQGIHDKISLEISKEQLVSMNGHKVFATFMMITSDMTLLGIELMKTVFQVNILQTQSS